MIKVQFHLRADDMATRLRDISLPGGISPRELASPSRLGGGEPFIEIRIRTHLGSNKHTKPRDSVSLTHPLSMLGGRNS
jgi:hypothetical protein